MTAMMTNDNDRNACDDSYWRALLLLAAANCATDRSMPELVITDASEGARAGAVGVASNPPQVAMR